MPLHRLGPVQVLRPWQSLGWALRPLWSHESLWPPTSLVQWGALRSGGSKLSLWAWRPHLRHVHWHLLRWMGLLETLRNLRHRTLSWKWLGCEERGPS